MVLIEKLIYVMIRLFYGIVAMKYSLTGGRNLIYITGDTHRDFSRIAMFCWANQTTIDDVLIILGDVGINYYGNPSDLQLKHVLATLPITLFCIHGNHENRPENIDTYEEAERFGGKVHTEADFPNLLFAKDGEIYSFDGKKRCLVIGGAYSIDKHIRIKNAQHWWGDEQPSEQTKERIEGRITQHDWGVDIVLSHTCPKKYMPVEAFLTGFDRSVVDSSTEEWLDTIESRLTYSSWYCGHFHTEKVVDGVHFLYKSIEELG